MYYPKNTKEDKMVERLKQILKELDEAIQYCEALDHGYTTYYFSLLHKRTAIRRAIRVFEIEDRRLTKRGNI